MKVTSGVTIIFGHRFLFLFCCVSQILAVGWNLCVSSCFSLSFRFRKVCERDGEGEGDEEKEREKRWKGDKRKKKEREKRWKGMSERKDRKRKKKLRQIKKTKENKTKEPNTQHQTRLFTYQRSTNKQKQ